MTVKRNFEQFSGHNVLTCFMQGNKSVIIRIWDIEDVCKGYHTLMDKDDLTLFIAELEKIKREM